MTSKQEIDRTPLSVEVRLGIFFLILFLVSILLSKKQIEPVITTIEEIELPKSSIEIVRGDTSKMQVIFTFDGGSRDVSGNKILDVLSKHGLKTTFFLTGDFVALNPDLVKRMHQLGHEIFNHTQNHHYLTSLSSGEIASELQNMDKALVGITNKSSKPYFRPPYGDRDQRVSETAFEAGYQSVMWTVDALDWQESEGRTRDEVRNIILNSLSPGNIYLIHLGDSISGDILDDLIITIKERGYNIVSLKQGL